MFTLAMSSVRQRPGRFVATLLSAFLGAVIIMTFNSLHDTAGARGVDDVSAESMSTAATVVGGYGSLLVFFAVASTLTVNVRQRGGEIGLLRSTGATPAQIKRMVVGEAAVVGLVGALLAIAPAMLAGRGLLAMFQESGQVAGSVRYAFGPIALVSGLGIALLASVGAAFLAVRRATGTGNRVRRSGGRGRKSAGYGALVAGTGSALTTFAMDGTDPMAMAPAAYGAILLAAGFAVFSPVLLGTVLGRLSRPIEALAGAGGYLAVHTMRRRVAELSGVLMPLILFTGMATATLYIQAVETDAIKASGLTKSVEDKNLETLNLVVVGIIVVFSCVMLVNSLYAATSYRRGEFGRQRLTGATPGQVLAMVGCEGGVLTVTGVFLGSAAGLAGIVPFTSVRTGGILPGQGLGIWFGIVAVASAATLVTSLGTACRALRTPAVAAVAVAA
ncbi:transporter [Streptomyces agglomeratus]|uniref:Transporter n=1 Tax=Streptomyces agglomeratus TaxID=285458 RepID=A0A1E5P8B1_9ACTN|nr:ABC transporter permease [Streptomyces agglomeratus]OEJ25770.1 transporter [Streptomyces agglomeratus]OEJ52738.1 transporter [Streptomyces agglomeratus]OEJ60076.1 transporter [Streptomyces agglomeratus]